MPHTPKQSSHSSVEDEMEVQGSNWNARDRTVIARMEQYMNASNCMWKLRSWRSYLVQKIQKSISGFSRGIRAGRQDTRNLQLERKE